MQSVAAAVPSTRGPTVIYSTARLAEVNSCGCVPDRGGLARQATYLARARAQGPVLLVEAGDTFFKNYRIDPKQAPAAVAHARSLTNLLAAQGLVATAVGEADLAIGLDMLEVVAKEAPFAVLAANLITKDGRRPFQSSLVHKLGSLQVGLIGLVSAHVGVDRTPAPVKVESPAKRLKQVLAAFDPQPDRVVLLAHMSPKEARELLEQVRGIDLAVLGHPMGHKTPAAVVGKSLLVGTDIRGRELGEAVLPVGRALAIGDHHLVPLTPAIGLDAKVTRALDAIRPPR